MALDDLILHDECGSLQFDLNDDAGSFTQDRHLPMLFLESDCVFCEPCWRSNSTFQQQCSCETPQACFVCFAYEGICQWHISVG